MGNGEQGNVLTLVVTAIKKSPGIITGGNPELN
jgi:hypothetical protein